MQTMSMSHKLRINEPSVDDVQLLSPVQTARTVYYEVPRSIDKANVVPRNLTKATTPGFEAETQAQM